MKSILTAPGSYELSRISSIIKYKGKWNTTALSGYAAKWLHSTGPAVRKPFHFSCPVVRHGEQQSTGKPWLKSFYIKKQIYGNSSSWAFKKMQWHYSPSIYPCHAHLVSNRTGACCIISLQGTKICDQQKTFFSPSVFSVSNKMTVLTPPPFLQSLCEYGTLWLLLPFQARLRGK